MRARLRAGEPAAFAELFDVYARGVYNHAFRLTANWSTAEDVMATTFMEAWRLRDRIDAEGGSLRPWLLGIATNTARNQIRSNRSYRRAAVATAAAELPVVDHADEVATHIDDQRRLAAVLRALGSLRRAEREVVAPCLGEGLDYEAAAKALGIPVGTVASRLSRARKKLRSLTEAEFAQHGDAATADRHVPSGPVRPAPRTRSVDAAEKVRSRREAGAADRQIPGDRVKTVRPAQEGNR
ncbi:MULTISPECIES: RNA polymerase sigma factor [Streptomycetaceae]|uniref:ECF subfamily RNA polymerase sigma factor n=1 Tax=Streptantibioticus cattleyicolor (strain ATCC 35852 / DSM 46488 / JCM 4925 / NBRC 14057 / NRRL 8057) TaxID=1003195 RepID=F8JQX7_STREN|nr:MULTISPECIES: sigma-70 family RNA polymerase sigma factor [Streptomycetaceae]AEW92863.1 ECF subfamily RNA polymerase sigma factor [Streptantibioticus cattleyicolor NRRL 8057 = DSM 46488]MYS57620.1 sigma-70 family RNA polymerase sigma factor [Streptomyces sp. SID5468]CCB73221.1 putative RNA polymerase ECF-subfamily sigma factor [Streptantibioticus cattleyicolor NRRL 8057 = DSM 46488]